ncbi:nSTAND1 domain-containing NTPase [Streptosporangium canum]|uniref:nSTAND1 domain-containing NTPase n=1 Tax=Streptosporangium canum TaxID=324952 RepID=UPI0037A75966
MTGPKQLPPERQKLRDALRELRDQASGLSLSQQQLINRANRQLAEQGTDELRPQTVSGWFANGAVAQDFRQVWALIQVMVELSGRLPDDLNHPLWRSERRWWKERWEKAGSPAPRRASRREADEDCPYPGLRSFTKDEARWFFGRKALASLVKERLERSLIDHRPLVVVAPSGAGKSSLLQAGLLPDLEAGKLPGSRHWPQVLLTPTADPPAALAAKLAALTGAEEAELAAANPDELAALVRERLCLTPGGRVVLVVDQLEELFTLCPDERQRHRFVDALTGLTRGAVALGLYGLRADFYGSCADFPHLRDALAERQVIVSAMTDDEVRQAVTLPAEDSGLSLATGLVDIILRDLRGATGQGSGTYRAELLPRLAHALRVMWLNREGDTLTVAGYHASGGIDGAIASTAEDEFASLTTEPARNAARLLFLGLVRIGDNGEATRRRRTRDELVRDAADPQAVEDVLDRFIRARLLTQGAERKKGPVTIEVTHEALLWAWPQLRA